MASKCPYDPKDTADQPMGMYHCPLCGNVVVAGMDHSDYSLLPEDPDPWRGDVVKIKIDYRPRDLTHRCQGCGEWMTAPEAASHCRTGGHDAEGNPWPDACGPIDEVPRDDITIWLRDQDEAGCHEAADELDAMRKRLSDLAEAGTGYSQQVVDALTKERDWLQQELTRYTAELTTLDDAVRLWNTRRLREEDA